MQSGKGDEEMLNGWVNKYTFYVLGVWHFALAVVVWVIPAIRLTIGAGYILLFFAVSFMSFALANIMSEKDSKRTKSEFNKAYMKEHGGKKRWEDE